MMRLLQLALALTVLAWLLAGYCARQLPAPGDIAAPLFREPEQTPTDRPPFQLDYRGVRYDIEPVAAYDLYGLVVSHNDTHAFLDVYHDRRSLDSKDLCVLWGDNLRRENFRRAQYSSSPFFCYVQWRAGGEIDMTQLSNNHLVTDRDDLRRVLESVEVGDQVHFHGWLVNYRSPKMDWRRSSTVRTDTGGGACEVVFYDQLEVLARHAPLAYALRKILPGVALLVLLAMLAVAATTDPKLSSAGG